MKKYVLLVVLAVCCSALSGLAEEMNAKELRNNPKLGFAPLPIKFGEAVGLVVHFNQGETLRHLADLKNLGVKWVRDEESWGRVEKKKGQYIWPAKRKRRLKFYKENGIGVIFALTYAANKNVYPGDPYNPKGFGAYAVAAAKLHEDAGVNVVLEIFNEPHNFGLRKKYGGKPSGSKDCAWIDHYIKMANEAVKQVKAYDSKIKLITDEDVWSNHYWFLDGNLDKRLDGFAIHPYTSHARTPGPEVSHYGTVYPPWTIADNDRSSRSLMRRLRAQYMEKLEHPAEMYITEWGHQVGGKGFTGSTPKMTEDDIVAYLVRAYINGVAAGARVVCWHVSQDMGDGPMGLIRNNQTKRKTYYALKNMVKQLGDYQLVKQVAGMNNTTRGIQAYLFKGDNDYKLVAWNIDGSVNAKLDPASKQTIKVSSSLGKAMDFSLSSFKLGRSPVYIEGIGKDCSLKLALKLIDNFSKSKCGFTLGREFKGAKGRRSLSMTEFISKPASMCINYDFSKGGRYIGITRKVNIKENAKTISFQAKVSAENPVFMVIIDSKRQYHRSRNISLNKVNAWQKMIFGVNKRNFPHQWGGGKSIKKGKIYFPIKTIWICTHTNGRKIKEEGREGQKGKLYIDDLSLQLSAKPVKKTVDKDKAPVLAKKANVSAYLKKYNSAKYLKGYKLVKQIAGAKNPNKGVQAYLFEGDAGYKLVAWSTGGAVKVLFEPGYTLRPRVSNHSGRSVKFGYSKDGPPILTLNKAPIFAEGIGRECSIELLN